MSQPLHARAPAAQATSVVTNRTVSSPLLDDWSFLSPIALPMQTAMADERTQPSWPDLLRALLRKSQPSRAA